MEPEKKRKNSNPEVHTRTEVERQQLVTAKKQLWYFRVITVLLLVVVIALGASTVAVVPKVNHVLSDVEQISRDLSSQEPMDMEALNSAIQDLDSLLSPLAKLLGKE